MKRLVFVIVLICVLSVNSFAAAAAPVEKPEVKFIFDEVPVTLTDIPLNLNGRTMLPLRSVLAALGVPNDDEHIIWNQEELSVTVNYDGISVYMKCDSKLATINGEVQELEAPPFLYAKNSRVYIPVRFIAGALGKEAAWDGYTGTVYLRDRSRYDEAGNIITRIENSMSAASRIRLDTKMLVTVSENGEETKFEVTLEEEADRTGNVLYSRMDIPVMGQFVSFEYYYKDNMEYGRNSVAGAEWRKIEMEDEDFIKIFENEMSLKAVNTLDVLSAAMTPVDTENLEEVVLRGNVYPGGIAGYMTQFPGFGDLEIQESQVEITAGTSDWSIKRVLMRINGRFKHEGGYSEVTADIEADYSYPVNGLVLPDFEE